MLQTRVSAALLVASLCMAGQALAQQQASQFYHRTQCIKAEPGKLAELERFALDVGHKVVTVRANAGEYMAAALLRSVYPDGEEATCDFVAVTIHKGFPQDPDSIMKPDTVLEKAGVGMSAEEYGKRLRSMGKLVNTELWRAVDGFGQPEKGDYIRVDLMKPRPGQAAEWLKMEREIFKSVHQARAEQGFLRGWSVLTLAYPSGTSLPWNGATINIMPHWKDVGTPTGGYTEAFQKVRPDADMAATMQKVAGTRDIVRTELYHVLDTVMPTMQRATRTKK